jgi:hypothetical protein
MCRYKARSNNDLNIAAEKQEKLIVRNEKKKRSSTTVADTEIIRIMLSIIREKKNTRKLER